MSDPSAAAQHSCSTRAPTLQIQWDEALERAWSSWLEPAPGKVHFDYTVAGGDLRRHVDTSFSAALESLRGMVSAIDGPAPVSILDHGSSAGFKGLALQRLFPLADVEGIDPDTPAIELAETLAARLDRNAFPNVPRFRVGVGERLPYPDATFDLVVSITVIEHVQDVDACLSEIARVLRPGGVLYLEAPNYLWPFEPHLGVLLPPLCPKPLARLLARLQGRGEMVSYLDHLRWVHPRWTERRLRELGFQQRNLFEEKIDAALEAGASAVVHYSRAANLLRVLHRLGLSRVARAALRTTKCYPSQVYIATRS